MEEEKYLEESKAVMQKYNIRGYGDTTSEQQRTEDLRESLSESNKQ